MDREIKIIVVKFMIITALVIAYVFIMYFVVAPMLVQQVYGQFNPADQYNPSFQQQQYGYDQYNQQQFQQPYQQGYDQYNQPYQQYGTPTYSPYGMQQPYGVPQQYGSNTVLGFGIQEIVTALIAGGGATAYARRRTNKLEEDKQLIMAEMMRDKQKLAELARVSYEKMPKQGFEVTDAPSVKLETLNNDIEKFTNEVAKA